MSFLSLERVSKSYGSISALNDVDLEILEGELFFLLGPSGCGKTTLLRVLAGLSFPDGGRVLLFGKEITRQAAHLRSCGMVFQDFALWPHLTAGANVAFGLKARHVDTATVHSRVEEALALVKLDGFGGRSVHELSGGQRQRVALARALVLRPKFLLLDEPLSGLDAPLRMELRREIRFLCQQAKVTAICVTHDPADAVAMADRVGLFEGGKLIQVGLPQDLLLSV